MFLSPELVAQTREQTLNNLLGLSSTCFSASQRLSDLFSAAGRDALHLGSKQFAQFGHGQLDSLTSFPAVLWLENSARTSRLLDSAYEILGETHKSLIQSAEAQVQAFDQIVFATINRAAKNSPWEGEIALAAMRTTLETAERTLHGMSAAAVETVDLAENEVHQIAENLTENKQTTRPNGRGRTTSR